MVEERKDGWVEDEGEREGGGGRRKKERKIREREKKEYMVFC